MIKLVVWDLDNTLWEGVLLEGDGHQLRTNAMEVVRSLDKRGILQSVASRNDYTAAVARLEKFGLAEYFLHPQIGWGSKSEAIARISIALNVDFGAMAFVDDQEFERDEVVHVHPAVHCIDAIALTGLLERPELNPVVVTLDGALRRLMYRADEARQQAQAEFTGPDEAFLQTLGMRCVITSCAEGDLERAQELTQRTHQLNTTGCTYSAAELDAFRQSPNHLLLMASLDDRYGSYGKIGLALVEKNGASWTLKLLLMSCRVMSRGVGTIMIHHVMSLARAHGVRFMAEFRHNGKNRMMYVTYRFGGFREVSEHHGLIVLEHPLNHIPPHPPYVDVQVL